eukprot:TRINITY_DN1505_c0_g3_i1.p1 TRINITY_DN1505_c0_g3~~TRINITY_DN1505_c0_g3_i1.p1  ORF type:complete len:487 (-),score=108.40 TRINITY_DN1505_c0_g3_i1:131-1591(-)
MASTTLRLFALSKSSLSRSWAGLGSTRSSLSITPLGFTSFHRVARFSTQTHPAGAYNFAADETVKAIRSLLQKAPVGLSDFSAHLEQVGTENLEPAQFGRVVDMLAGDETDARSCIAALVLYQQFRKADPARVLTVQGAGRLYALAQKFGDAECARQLESAYPDVCSSKSVGSSSLPLSSSDWVPESRTSSSWSLPGAPTARDSVTAPASSPEEPATLPDDDSEMAELFRRQQELETEAYEKAVERYKKLSQEVTRLGRAAALKPGEKLLLQWFEPLRAVIEQEQNDVRAVLQGDKDVAGQFGVILSGSLKSPEQIPQVRKEGEYLLRLPADKLAVIVLHTVLGMLLHHTEGIPFTQACMDLGRAVQAEANMMRLKQEHKLVHRMLVRTGKADSVFKALRATRGVLDESEWKQSSVAFVGGNLLHTLIRSAFVPEDQFGAASAKHEPAFQHRHASVSSPFSITPAPRRSPSPLVKDASIILQLGGV